MNLKAVDVLAHGKIIEQMTVAADVFMQTATHGLLDEQSPPNSDKHGQKQAAVFSPGGFSFLAAYPRHCPRILP